MNLDNLPTSEYIILRDKVTKYVRSFQLRSGMMDCPTIERIAKSLRLKQANVLEFCEDAETLCVNIGFQIPQVGWAVYDRIGEYQIECLSDEIWIEHERRQRRGRYNNVQR